MDERLTTPLTLAFGRRVRTLRKARGWSQERLGAEPGLTTASVRRIERGQNTTLATAEQMAEVFNVPLAVLLDPDSCPVCHGAPPRGFTCQTCDAGKQAPETVPGAVPEVTPEITPEVTPVVISETALEAVPETAAPPAEDSRATCDTGSAPVEASWAACDEECPRCTAYCARSGRHPGTPHWCTDCRESFPETTALPAY